MLDDHGEYKMKINKLMICFDNGYLPDTDFVNSFMVRVNAKFKSGATLTPREKEVLDDMFEKY